MASRPPPHCDTAPCFVGWAREWKGPGTPPRQKEPEICDPWGEGPQVLFRKEENPFPQTLGVPQKPPQKTWAGKPTSFGVQGWPRWHRCDWKQGPAPSTVAVPSWEQGNQKIPQKDEMVMILWDALIGEPRQDPGVMSSWLRNIPTPKIGSRGSFYSEIWEHHIPGPFPPQI